MAKGVNLTMQELHEKLIADINNSNLPIGVIRLELMQINAEVEKAYNRQLEIEQKEYEKEVDE